MNKLSIKVQVIDLNDDFKEKTADKDFEEKVSVEALKKESEEINEKN